MARSMRTVGGLREHLASLRESPAYRHYEYVRDVVLKLKEREARSERDLYRPSEYWSEELANFDYMLDASPLIIQKLRHHCHHVTGLRVYDYRTHKDNARLSFEEKLRALTAMDTKGLLVPESRELGGFGFEIDGSLFNIDTLKFYEALIALDRGAILEPFRTGMERRIVLEIGAGWGGFAFQFKTLCPNVTYVMMDFPELFLFSGVYLMTAFPHARIRFAGDRPDGALFDDWQQMDFVFVPHFDLEVFAPPRVDLTVNMVSFQEMTTDQVRAYVQRAYDLRSPFLYSLNRNRSPYNVELTSVEDIVAQYYWPHEIPVLPVSYPHMLASEKGEKEKARRLLRLREDLAYRHIVGRRRILL